MCVWCYKDSPVGNNNSDLATPLGNYWPLLTCGVEGKYALIGGGVYMCVFHLKPSHNINEACQYEFRVFELYWCTEAAFCKAFITAKVVLIAILREQTETGLKGDGERNKTLARIETKKAFICAWLVSKFKGTGLSLCANV